MILPKMLMMVYSSFWSHMVAFSVHYLNTPLDYINHLIDKSFNSHQLFSSIRGTTRLCMLLIFKHFTKSCFLYPPNMATI